MIRGEKYRAILEDLGFLVLRDGGSCRNHFVRKADGSPLGFYQLNRDLTFRSGWVELPRSAGRTDIPDWPSFWAVINSHSDEGKNA